MDFLFIYIEYGVTPQLKMLIGYFMQEGFHTTCNLGL